MNLDHVEEVVQHILSEWDAAEEVSSWRLHRRIGAYLDRHTKGRGSLKSAYRHTIPVFFPAFSDSELGLDFVLHKKDRERQGKPPLRFNSFDDFEEFARVLFRSKRMGVFTVGGGVPRNWTQQFGVYSELLTRRGYEDVGVRRYHYGLRICPEPVHWGGLSGSPSPASRSAWSSASIRSRTAASSPP